MTDFNKTTFTYERVTYNSVKGWIVTMRVDGVFAGKSFGRTRAAAVESVLACYPDSWDEVAA